MIWRRAKELNRKVLRVFSEDQVYRIDHYLGKETVQNILVFRFSNGIFEPIWNRRYIDNVQITVAEQVGWKDAQAITRAPGRCATSCRTICFNYSRSPRWSRLSASRPTRCAMKK